jgi:hypothetical protein
VEARRPHLTYRRLTDSAAWLYLHPSPWRDNLVLVARRAAHGAGTWGLCSFQADQRRCEPVFDSPDYHEVQAVFVKPRPRPDGHSTVVDTKFDAGIFYGLNCYDADPRLASHLQTGMVKRVRFIEGMFPAPAPPAQAPPPDSWLPRRLVGEAPVEADGSFNVEVPADTPLLLQTLDERGLALANCGWIWVKPKEKRGCIGCHEDPERIPENNYVLALRRPSNRLVLPPDQRRSVAFRRDIAPLLQQSCATAVCHSGKDTPLPLPLAAEKPSEEDLRRAYMALMAPGKNSQRSSVLPGGKYVEAGRARTSGLIWRLAGANTSRPWDYAKAPANPGKVKPMPPPGHGRPFNDAELRTVIQWIDLGAPYEAAGPGELQTATQAETK